MPFTGTGIAVSLLFPAAKDGNLTLNNSGPSDQTTVITASGNANFPNRYYDVITLTASGAGKQILELPTGAVTDLRILHANKIVLSNNKCLISRAGGNGVTGIVGGTTGSPSARVDEGQGGNGNNANAGGNGTIPTNTNFKAQFSGAGGNGGASSFAAGTGGVPTHHADVLNQELHPLTHFTTGIFQRAVRVSDGAQYRFAGGGGGGGGGSGSAPGGVAANTPAGGSGGNGGGFMGIVAHTIDLSGGGIITVSGGNGGKGGDSIAAGHTGAGGGGGGGGGTLLLVYGDLILGTGQLLANGGNGGNRGIGNAASNGSPGNGGGGGLIIQISETGCKETAGSAGAVGT